MYDTRFSPSYQIPYVPIYQTTRLEIERSLSTLQEKLRRRREIDQQLARPLNPPVYPSYVDPIRLEQEQFRMEREINMRLKFAEEAQHIKRLQLLRNENNFIQRESQYQRRAVPAQHYEEQDDLLKKYQNGSKAKQYYQDLEMQSHKQKQEDIEKKIFQKSREIPVPSERRKGMSQHKDFSSTYKKNVYQTPYDIIKEHPKTVQKDIQEKRSALAQQLQKEFDKLQGDKNIKPEQTFANTIKESSPFKLSNRETSPKKMARYQSMGKFGANRSKSPISPLKKSMYNESYLQSRHQKSVSRVKPSLKEVEFNALKKIQNRLKVAKVMYQDSQFRNIKYEANHLSNTFEIEGKLRKEIRQKINNHPSILRKHALVVD